MTDFLKIICLFLLSGTCLAAEIGDYSPLQVENTWIYTGSMSHFQNSLGVEISDERSNCNRTIKVVSRNQVRDTLIYSIKVIDTIFNRFSKGIPMKVSVVTKEFLVKERLGVILPNDNLIGNDNLLVFEEVFFAGVELQVKCQKIKDIGVYN